MDNINLGRHISGQFNEDLENVINHVMHMGGLVEKQLSDSLTAVYDADEVLAKNVLANDYKINALEVSIDDECTRIIAKRQPAAGDLRLIMAIVKTIADLERIGDEAQKIARVALENFSGEQKALLLNLDNLGRKVLEFLQATLDAFTRMDVDSAVLTHGNDEKIDREYEALMRQLMTYMMEDPRSIPQIMSVIWSARALERIGDRCQNICEYIIYFVKGKDVRHTTAEDIKSL
ncbi:MULTISPECIES: phosphate signaling complex protein PhoU [unclassified Colwellia]|jgi:phosphate transport system protein|uniref:phosphate signaling complex protein PhoU n=1 Tax=unclassified Colwellia TaxID=196834 RepID=UPI0015F4F9B2|nr:MULTISPECIES: phosphate signaling complex protein PhoU [unclassified Colwellia]MBA6362746.1 phosphate signaling complex protein PhoU [Colwellia sp. BRX8-8]MBA6253887.1 phosphate signaling complex protein PhoU [Colwellia sp. MB3u-55]MBA6335780.1 phosphate signaling complex protein PhoU [Colwellia sp. BRX8-7]MBA6347399.1 phosphate signaling complex protein PhoU [Colwellia sp. BRX8-9]MBA6350857.1 phosphate signaling complex protein PhoU [Colwellia sp. BRX9-1]|tara:strand:- start:874 stop:1575 length:702 start_codon:yes stop_codon:yes gene_type:complete